MPEYTVAAVCAVAAVVGVELVALRTGLLSQGRFWLTIAVVWAFQVLVDGFLTWPGRAVVLYDPRYVSGLRWPAGIPVEDYAFGFAMVTLAMLVWSRPVHR